MSNGEPGAGSHEVAVVTGGASGFGLALATRFAEREMKVALLDVDADRAAGEAAAIASAHGVETLGLAVNVADDAAVQSAARAVADRFGRADLVMSNVGVQLFGSVERLTDREWQWVLDVNVVGAARIARAFIPLLRSAPRGRLGFTTSSSVLDPASRLGAIRRANTRCGGWPRPSPWNCATTASRSPSSSRPG